MACRNRPDEFRAEWTGLACVPQPTVRLQANRFESRCEPRRRLTPLREMNAVPAFDSEKENARLRGHLYLAEWTGLEPATPGVTGRYSNQLNYHSILLN